MADITTTITVNDVSAYMRAYGFVNREGHEPLRQVVCAGVSVAIALTGVGDNQQLQLDITLPAGKAYQLVNAQVRLLSGAGDTNNFGGGIQGLLQSKAAPATADGVQMIFAMESPYIANLQGDYQARIYHPVDMPRAIMEPDSPGGSVQALFNAYNTTANDAAYTCDFYCRFFEYMNRDALDYPANRLVAVI